MHFLALAIIAICVLVITYKNPRWGFITLGAVLALGALLYWLTPTESTQREASPLTPYAQLSQESVGVGYAESFELSARLSNSHLEKSLSAVYINSQLQECETDDPGACVVLGEETNVVKIFIPPEQARDIFVKLDTKTRRPLKGNIKWTHSIVSAQ